MLNRPILSCLIILVGFHPLTTSPKDEDVTALQPEIERTGRSAAKGNLI